MTTKRYQTWQVKDQVIVEDTDPTKRRRVTEADVIIQSLVLNVVTMADPTKGIAREAKVGAQ